MAKNSSFVLLFLILIAVSGLIAIGFYFHKTIVSIVDNQIPDYDILSSNEKTNVLETADEKITLFAVGDIMLDRGVKYNIEKYGKGDYKFPFLNIADYLLGADILFGNLEGQISDKGRNVGSIYSFRVDPKAIEGIKYAGFDIVSVANNHAFDYTASALEDSLRRLKEVEIEYVGGGFNEEEAFSLKVIDIKNTKIGFLAYNSVGSESWRAAKDHSGIAFIAQNDIEKIKEEIKEAKEKVDILIVSFHSGVEYQTTPSSFQTNSYHSIIDSGADLIIGHHPHVSQPIEEYNGRWIAYSLGNFVFDQGFSEDTMKGLLLEVVIDNKIIKKVEGREIKMNKYFQPELVSLD